MGATPVATHSDYVDCAMASDIPIRRTYAGVAPFVASDIARVVVLAAFPAITLWLVRVMF